VSPVPVIGIGEAAFHAASLIGWKFSVVTTLSRSIAVIEQNLLRYGLQSRCARVRAANVPVLHLEDSQSEARKRLSREIGCAVAADGADAVVLGYAGMARLAADLGAEHQLPVIDGVAAAVGLAAALVRMGAATSRRGPYAQPIQKIFRG
jgi:allantoin racemase